MPTRDDDYDLAPDPHAQPKRKTTVAPAAATAAQQTGPVSAGGFVRGGRLVVKDGASLPDRCIQCNAPAADGRITKRFAYNQDNRGPGAATWIPLIGRLVWMFWLLGRLNTREYLTVSYCVCKKHRATKLLAIAAMAIGIIAGTGVIITGFRHSDVGPRGGGIDSTTIIVGVLLFFAGALCGLAISSLQIAVTLNGGAELKGAGKRFLESMPKFSKTLGPR